MRILGIDGGIASIGWALLDIPNDTPGQIVSAGVWMFDAPEESDRTPKNAMRRQYRGQRRVIRRRRQRMAALRHLFAAHGLLANSGRDALQQTHPTPWKLRAEGLDRVLEPAELAVALGHIARHRGFRSNSKRDHGANAPSDTSKMLKAVDVTRERLAQWRTAGEMFFRDPEFAERKRNRGGDFSRSILRCDLEAEARAIFAAQRRLDSTLATEDLERRFADLAFSQRPLQDSEGMVQQCPFEPTEKRTARRGYTFELFRLLSRLNTLKIAAGRAGPQRLTSEQIAAASRDFGRQKKISFKSLRKLLDLDPRTRFEGVAPEDEEKDVVARSGNAAEGTATLRDAIGDGPWRALLDTPEVLDRIAEVITFREAPERILAGLRESGVSAPVIEAIMAKLAGGVFGRFTGAGHISAKAARALIKPLQRGLDYSEACEEAGYNHAARPATRLEDIRNPVARKALTEMIKQVRAITREYGRPDLIHVELARDVGKSVEEREEIKRGIDDRNKEKDQRRNEFAELLGREPDDEELLRFELWKEQNGRCLYSDSAIPPTALVASDNSVQVDHILPWSRFGDDSFANKTLCTAAANQRKRGRTPFEWFHDEFPDGWDAYTARVESCKGLRPRKKRGFYLRQNAAEVEEQFRNRSLNDTRYATRILLDVLGRMYSREGERPIRARPGALTSKLRRAWGLEDIKKDEAGKRRRDDRHHALDAIVVAATSESQLNALTRAAQTAERAGLPRSFDLSHVPEPWPGFADAARAATAAVFVARPERRRARGEAHAATIRQVRAIDGATVVFERKPIDKLTLKDLEAIPTPKPYGGIADPAKLRNGTVAALREWIEAGKPKDHLPCSPKGDVIRKVRVSTGDKVAVEVRGGTTDRGEMARVDVFAETDKRGRRRFYLVPVYPHQVADQRHWPAPPNRAVVAHKSEAEWTVVGQDFQFLFSLNQNSLVTVTKPDGEIISGYFKGLDRQGAQIALASPHSAQNLTKGIGSKTLLHFRKFAVSRLGVVTPIERETRTWHGVVCT